MSQPMAAMLPIMNRKRPNELVTIAMRKGSCMASTLPTNAAAAAPANSM
jgi:hypothetical protein